METIKDFSVLMAVYNGDKAEWLEQSILSVINQSIKPYEIVLVVDGPISNELNELIDQFKNNYNEFLNVIRLDKNQGLGNALSAGLQECKCDYVARMDSDDISVENRFEIQLKKMQEDENISICGGQIAEFIDATANVVGRRIVPESDTELKEFLKIRCPFNHMTVMFKKDEVLAAGGYKEWFWNEDYYLWIRMALNGAIFANVPDVLVSVRVGNDMYARRGGDKYFKSEIGIQKLMLQNGLINRRIYLSNCFKRFIVQKLMPNGVRAWVFKRFARTR